MKFLWHWFHLVIRFLGRDVSTNDAIKLSSVLPNSHFDLSFHDSLTANQRFHGIPQISSFLYSKSKCHNSECLSPILILRTTIQTSKITVEIVLAMTMKLSNTGWLLVPEQFRWPVNLWVTAESHLWMIRRGVGRALNTVEGRQWKFANEILVSLTGSLGGANNVQKPPPQQPLTKLEQNIVLWWGGAGYTICRALCLLMRLDANQLSTVRTPQSISVVCWVPNQPILPTGRPDLLSAI